MIRRSHWVLARAIRESVDSLCRDVEKEDSRVTKSKAAPLCPIGPLGQKVPVTRLEWYQQELLYQVTFLSEKSLFYFSPNPLSCGNSDIMIAVKLKDFCLYIIVALQEATIIALYKTMLRK